MESLDNASKTSTGFVKHVFKFDDESKGELLNIIQYAILAIVPIVVLNKVMQKYVPEASDEKGSLELVAEVIIQTLAMFVGIFFINRIITYIPTYSGVKYQDFNVVCIILAVLMITMSLQTKLGEKVSILSDRIQELWSGKSDTKGNKKGSVRVSQPLSGQGQGQGQGSYREGLTDMKDGNSTAISSLPSVGQMAPQQSPDFNEMYKKQPTPLINAATPGSDNPYASNEPMAANEAMGGMFGGSSF